MQNDTFTVKKEQGFSLLTCNDILTTNWPDPVWAVPELLPVGLSILAGKPKAGKSWLALQLALAVSSGGMFLNKEVEIGRTLYLALEDPPQRLQKRMRAQGWQTDLNADFMPLGQFEYQIGDISNGGSAKLSKRILEGDYKLIIIDTFSRAINGDQSDVYQMTQALTPIQEIAHDTNSVVMLIDHHRKNSNLNADAISDILGSTAKGAMCDTIWGLYRENGKAGAQLSVIGREVEEQTLGLSFDKNTGSWVYTQEIGQIRMTERRQEILDLVSKYRALTLTEISESIEQDKSNTYKRLQDLVNYGYLQVEKRADIDHYSIAS